MFNHVAYSFFSVAAVVIGLSYCSVTALITTYVDDAASAKNNAIYLGVYSTSITIQIHIVLL